MTTDKIKILHLRAGSFYGGPERQLHLHSLRATKMDVDIAIGSFTEAGRPPEFLNIIGRDNIKTHLFAVRNPYDPTAISSVRKYLRENNIHILCTHDYRTQLIGFLSVKKTGTKWIAFSRGWTSENLKIKTYNLLDKILLRFADRIVAVSDSQKRKLKKALIPDKKITVVLNAVEPECFKNVEKIDLHARYDFPKDAIVCVSGGRFSKEKGFIYLVRAALDAVGQNDSIRFILFGEGPDLAKIRKMIAQSGFSDRILCPGFEKNFIGCLKGADMLINPSLSEGLPNVILESMSIGVPVLATAVGGVPELISDGQNGYLIPPESIDSLVTGILFLASNKVKRLEFSENARKLIKSEFTFDIQNRKLTSLYRELLDGSA